LIWFWFQFQFRFRFRISISPAGLRRRRCFIATMAGLMMGGQMITFLAGSRFCH
jgi:hypothetical protein